MSVSCRLLRLRRFVGGKRCRRRRVALDVFPEIAVLLVEVKPQWFRTVHLVLQAVGAHQELAAEGGVRQQVDVIAIPARRPLLFLAGLQQRRGLSKNFDKNRVILKTSVSTHAKLVDKDTTRTVACTLNILLSSMSQHVFLYFH